MKTLPVFLLTGLVACGCQRDSTTQPPVPAPLAVKGISPNPAFPGDTLRIDGTGFEPIAADNRLLILQRQLEIAGGSSTALFARAPDVDLSAPIIVRSRSDSILGPVLTITRACGGAVCIRQDPDVTVSDSSSSVVDCSNRVVHWTAQSHGDTISLIQEYCFGDDGAVRRRIRFLASHGAAAPYYLDGFVDFATYGVFTHTDTLRGYMTLKQWAVPGDLSGRVSTFASSAQPGLSFGSWSDFDFSCTIP